MNLAEWLMSVLFVQYWYYSKPHHMPNIVLVSKSIINLYIFLVKILLLYLCNYVGNQIKNDYKINKYNFILCSMYIIIY